LRAGTCGIPSAWRSPTTRCPGGNIACQLLAEPRAWCGGGRGGWSRLGVVGGRWGCRRGAADKGWPGSAATQGVVVVPATANSARSHSNVFRGRTHEDTWAHRPGLYKRRFDSGNAS
jgi:hypothetical protein